MSETPEDSPRALRDLLNDDLEVINLGLELFRETLEAQGVAVIQVDWRPPAGGDSDLSAMLEALQGR